MKYILLAMLMMLTACSEDPAHTDHNKPRDRSAWEDATVTHHCTDEQQRRVQSDTLFCKQNTSYFSSYCFSSAIMRNCNPKVNK